ncbi:beta-phosphoglucomutase [Halolactibacillus alkaliphilus]|uniref:Beta-phosphoglucomutase n=1 Tax=Halolactibacillus alkaliphilus TaxID=442899 RepID=A0A511WZG4_9BACI|nr:beta-phosphoglucomutase [Halolactibacillus alkaliphilus]GEN56087.1 beta-phosphoglucomutase [Halolactibacillus alkaliphilus]GGN67266.1 beta-phosphoglucomutase [Halolactibacillus alkaliphilus]SFO71227.1 beta-phosphoglucomutase [Halolactibacillus alkaliphilus]
MGMPKAVLFDLDGVIVDTAKHHYIAWRALANELGFEFTEHDNERLKGVSRMDSLNILLEVVGIELPDDKKALLAEQKNEQYVRAIKQMDTSDILPGVTDFLHALKEANIAFALGSASKNAPIILKNIGLLDAFDAIVDGNVISQAKPDPEVFLKGAKLLGVAPKDCVVFEDAQAGIDAGKNAGMYVVAVGDPEVLTGADDYIKDLSAMTLTRLEH